MDYQRSNQGARRAVRLGEALVFVPKLLPCVDYPQHIALGDIVHRLQGPGAPEHQNFQLSLFTYNALFQVVIAKLAVVVPIELAGKLVVAFSLGLMAAAVVALLRVVGRPSWYAALFTPLLFSFALGWGFVNYSLGTAIAFTAVVFVAAALRPSFASALPSRCWDALRCYARLAMLLCLLAASRPELAFVEPLREISKLRSPTLANMTAASRHFGLLVVHRRPVSSTSGSGTATMQPLSERLIWR